MSAAGLMFALPTGAAPLPTTYSAQAAADVWHVSRLDLDMSGNPAATDLSVTRVDGATSSTTTPRSLARAENVAGTAAAGQSARRGTLSSASNGSDTTTSTGGTAPAGAITDLLEMDEATLTSRGRWVGDTACLAATDRLTDSRAVSGGSNLVATAVPAEDPLVTIPVVDIPIPQPDGDTSPLPLPDPLDLPTDIPGLPTSTPTATEVPTLPTDLPTLTDIPTIPTELPSTILPTLTDVPTLPLPVAKGQAAAAGAEVAMVTVAPSAVEQHTWLAQKSARPDVRAVRAEAIGTPLNVNQPVVSFFDGEIAVRMASQPRLTAYADGVNKGIVTWAPPTMSLLVAGQSSPATIPADGTPVKVNYSGNRQVVVEVSAGQLTDEVEHATGLTASGRASALHVKITRATSTGENVVLDADLFPMEVEATSPTGGVECRIIDSDGDGLNDVREGRLGTDPTRKDTDGDRLTDGQEVKDYNTKPLLPDTDHDRLKDGAEVRKYKTEPRRADTDRDTLKDGVEVKKYGTNPRKKDTDHDGVNDGREVRRGTDPTKKDRRR